MEIITTKQVAEMLSVSEATIREAIQTKALKPILWLGTRPYRFDKEQIIKLIQNDSSLKIKSQVKSDVLPSSRATLPRKEKRKLCLS